MKMIRDLKNIETESKLVYSDISYEIIGSAFSVYNELGFGHMEKIYQRALAEEFKIRKLNFKEQVPYKVTYKGKNIGNSFFDFLVEGKVIVELKKSDFFSKKNIDQVANYLKVSGLQLALLINFSKNGVLHKRLVNLINNDQ